MARRLLVVGANGLVGRACVAAGVPGVDRAACDVRSAMDRESTLDRFKPDAILYCAARAEVDAVAGNPDAWAVNVDAAVAWARRVPLWYVSTNYVFSGPGPHGPLDPTAPLQPYGIQKATAEEAVLREGANVVRTGWVWGMGGRTFLSQLPTLLAQGPVRAIADVAIQPTWAPDLARFLMELPQGVTHAVGREETTWYDAARDVACRLGVPHRVVRMTLEDAGFPSQRPRDARLAPALLPGWSERLDAWLAVDETHQPTSEP